MTEFFMFLAYGAFAIGCFVLAAAVLSFILVAIDQYNERGDWQ